MATRAADTPLNTSTLTVSRWHGRALALDVDAPTAIIGVPPATKEEGPRHARLELISTDDFGDLWRPGKALRVFERSFADGKPMFTVEHDETQGYRVWAPNYGRHLVAPDGQTMFCAPPSKRGWWWQRLVLAQVLPIAATLQGLELLHASAVAFDDRAIAITAVAGSGKTSLAAHLLDLGADLVADDVLAIEVAGGRVIAHPGVSLVNIDPEQRAALGSRASAQLADSPGRGDKIYALAPVVEQPRPLAAIYFLQRAAEFTDLRFVEASGETRALLGSTFLPYLDTPARLLTHLGVCGQIAETVPSFVVEAPLGVSAADLARRVRSHGEDAW